jgi:hypothetical protein
MEMRRLGDWFVLEALVRHAVHQNSVVGRLAVAERGSMEIVAE